MKKWLLIIILIFISLAAYSQLACDPNDEIYSYITQWEEKGIVSGLPLLRPYSIQLIKSVLNIVIEKGSAQDQEVAQRYLDKFSQKFSLDIGSYSNMRTDFKDVYINTGLNVAVTGAFGDTDVVTASTQLGLFFLSGDTSLVLPRWTEPEKDFLQDWTSFQIGGRAFQFSQSLNSGAAIGNEKIYFQGGLMRTSFGPFYDTGSIISPDAPHAGHFSFVYKGKAVNVTTLLLALVASDSTGSGNWPDKYLAMHSISFFPGPVVEFGLLESVIYGDRFDPMYLLPFSGFYYNQVFSGVHDNSIAGLYAKFKLPQSININTTLYMDDIHFNDLVRFHFKTKYKLALQAGVSWTPLYPVFRRVAFEYLMITPYTYTHRNPGAAPEDPNFLNYTHKGQNLGSSLEPNSDRFLLQAALAFSPLVNIDIMAAFIRHGNASAGITDGDGTIFDDGYDDEENATFQDSTRFLSQDVLEYTFQFGIDSRFRHQFKKLSLEWGVGYTLEAIINKDLDEGENDINNILDLSLYVYY